MRELKPLPCPHCGSTDVGVWNFVVCKDCEMRGPRDSDESAAIAAWNALPRALRWTTEPPKVAGLFLAESTLDDGSKKITPIEVFPSDHWRHSDWEKRNGKLSCLLCLGGFGVCPVNKYSRFAGPIPAPVEG